MEMGIAYNRQYGLEAVNLVPVNMAGECDNFDLSSSHVIPALIRKFEEAKKGGLSQVKIWGDGSATREFLYAGDCANAIAIAVRKKLNPLPINLGTGKEISIADLASLIRDIGGYHDISIQWEKEKPNGQPRRCLDVSRAKSELGWEAETSITEILRKTIAWYNETK